MGSGISARLGLLSDEVDTETAKLVIGSYWSQDVQRSFAIAQNERGVVDRKTFLSLVKKQQLQREKQPKTQESHNVQTESRAESGQNSFRLKRPPLTLQLGVGSAAAGGAVKIGSRKQPGPGTALGLHRKRPPGLNLGVGSAAGGGAVKIGLDTKRAESKHEEFVGITNPLLRRAQGELESELDDHGSRLQDRPTAHSKKGIPCPLQLSREDAHRTDGSGKSDETPHFSETGTFHSKAFLIDAGGYRPSPPGGRKLEGAFERISSKSSSSRGQVRGKNLKDHIAKTRGSSARQNDSDSDCDGEFDNSDDMSVRSVTPTGLDGRSVRGSCLTGTEANGGNAASASIGNGKETESNNAGALKGNGPKGKKLKLSSEFVELYELGRGAGGRVFKAIHVPTLRPVALKRIKCNSPEKMAGLGHEISALAINYVPLEAFVDGEEPVEYVAPCPYLTTFHGAYTSDDATAVTLILELMDGGELQEFVSDGRRCSEPLLANTASRILKGLAFLHARKQVHRDIKPQNVLLHSKGLCKLSDFGILRSLEENEDFAETFTGTMLYMSPERVEGESYSYPSDIWSLGLLLYTLAEAKFPFIDDTFWSLRARFKNKDIPRLPLQKHSGDAGGYSPACCDFISRMLQADPQARSTAEQLLKHAFLEHHIDHEKRDKLDSTIVKAALVPTLKKKDSRQSEQLRRQLQDEEELSPVGHQFSSGFGSDASQSTDSDADLYADDDDAPDGKHNGGGSAADLKPRSLSHSSQSQSQSQSHLVQRGQRHRRSNSLSASHPSNDRAHFFENLLSKTTTKDTSLELELTIRKIVKHQVASRLKRPSQALINAFAKAMRMKPSRAQLLFETEWNKSGAMNNTVA